MMPHWRHINKSFSTKCLNKCLLKIKTTYAIILCSLLLLKNSTEINQEMINQKW